MKNKEHIVSYTVDQIKEMIASGEDKTDWAKAGSVTQEELEASIAADPDEAGMVIDWSSAMKGSPPPPPKKAVLNMRIDQDILDFFRRMGSGYQTHINKVLRAYVDHVGDAR